MCKEIAKYDENNNLIYYKDSDNYEYWKEYDENNNEIHYKNSDNYEYWKEYDENNKEIHYKNSNGYEYWNEYDENNKCIHYKDSYNYEYWKKYDSNGNVTYYKDSNGNEYWKEYDENNNLIYYKHSNGHEEWAMNNKGNKIIFKSYDEYKEFISKFDIKRLIKETIKTDPMIKSIYENGDNCFRNIVIPTIMNSPDNTLETIIAILANQSLIYDKLLNNIAKYGSKELMQKCSEDINSVFND